MELTEEVQWLVTYRRYQSHRRQQRWDVREGGPQARPVALGSLCT